MCAPQAVIVAGVALSAAATGASIYQSRQQAQAQADFAEEQIQAEATARAFREEDRRRRMQADLASQRVLFGQSGTLIDSSVLADTAAAYAREDFMDEFNTSRRLRVLDSNAEQAGISARNQAISSALAFGADTADSYIRFEDRQSRKNQKGLFGDD